MHKYYFTYAPDPKYPYPKYPYQDGYTVVEAPNVETARRCFRKFHPSKLGDIMLNCDHFYAEDSFEVIHPDGLIHGCGCRETITVTSEAIPVYNGEELTTIIESLTYSRNIIDSK